MRQILKRQGNEATANHTHKTSVDDETDAEILMYLNGTTERNIHIFQNITNGSLEGKDIDYNIKRGINEQNISEFTKEFIKNHEFQFYKGLRKNDNNKEFSDDTSLNISAKEEKFTRYKKLHKNLELRQNKVMKTFARKAPLIVDNLQFFFLIMIL